MDSNMAGMLDRCEDKLYTQLATLNVNDLVRAIPAVSLHLNRVY